MQIAITLIVKQVVVTYVTTLRKSHWRSWILFFRWGNYHALRRAVARYECQLPTSWLSGNSNRKSWWLPTVYTFRWSSNDQNRKQLNGLHCSSKSSMWFTFGLQYDGSTSHPKLVNVDVVYRDALPSEAFDTLSLDKWSIISVELRQISDPQLEIDYQRWMRSWHVSSDNTAMLTGVASAYIRWHWTAEMLDNNATYSFVPHASQHWSRAVVSQWMFP